jgi:neutral ceramidase
MKKVHLILISLIFIQTGFFISKVYSQETMLKAGIARTDITPTEGLFMGGYDMTFRPGRSQGAAGNIYIRALVFDDNVQQVVFIEADVVSLPDEDYISIRKLISEETGIPAENIMLGCVHNHAAPYPGEMNKDSDWYDHFTNGFVTTVKNAIADLEPVTIGGETGRSNIAMNRRKRMSDTLSYITFDENNRSQSYGKYKTDNPVLIRKMDGVYRLGANPKGPIDNEVGILRIDDMSGQPKAVLVNYACHGTSLGGKNYMISPEWNGHMLEYIEKKIPGVMGIFVPGAGGDVNPRFVGGLDGYEDDLENTANLGYEIGKEVVKVFHSIQTDIPLNPEIKLVHQDIVCPKRYGEVVKDFMHTTIDVPVTAIKIDEFVWVTFPVELFHEIGQTIKSSTHARYPFLVGYCNGSLGYLITQQAYSEGGYEPWSTQFAPVTEKIFIAGVEKMLISLY